MEINKNIIKLLSVLLILSCSFTVANGEVKELSVPEEVLQGDEVTISGLATPNEAVWIGSSFTVSLPVSSDGGYNHEFKGINFPEGEKKVTIRAERIKNMKVVISGIEVICDENNVSVITKVLGIPVTLMKSPSVIKNGVATLSLSLPREVPGVPVPIDLKGEQDVKVSGDAADDTTSVNLDFKMALKVIADTNGAFQEKLSTRGVPVGEFRITAGEKSANLRIVSELTPVATPTPAPTPTPTTPVPTSTPVPTPTLTSTPTVTPSVSVTVQQEITPTAAPATPTLTSTPTPTPLLTPAVSPGTASPSPVLSFSSHSLCFTIIGLFLAIAYLLIRRRKKL